MSLYYVQKLIYQLNRDPHTRKRYDDDFEDLLRDYDLTEEERAAIKQPDIGLLYVLGVNGQLLMHYAALRGYAWNEYLDAMRQGVADHGPVRAGLYAMTTGAEP
jgi:hypothetical protein